LDALILLDISAYYWKFAARYSTLLDWYCRIENVILSILKQFEGGLHIYLTSEKVVATKFPHKYKSMFTRNKIILTYFIIGLFSLAVGLPGAFFNGLTKTDGLYSCFESDVHNIFWRILVFVRAFFTLFLPVPAVAIGGFVVICALFKVGSGSHQLHTVKEKGRRVSVLSMTLVSVIFSVTQTLSASLILLRFSPSFGAVANEDIRQLILTVIPLILTSVNASVNIAFYCMPGTYFRLELVKLCHTCKTICKNDNNQQLSVKIETVTATVLTPREPTSIEAEIIG